MAWRYGPVFPRIYSEFKYKPWEVKEFAKDLDDTTKTLNPIGSNFNIEEKNIMNLVYEIYGAIDGWRLSVLTHQEGTPWYEVWHEARGKGIYGTSIPNDKIKEYFKKKVISF